VDNPRSPALPSAHVLLEGLPSCSGDMVPPQARVHFLKHNDIGMKSVYGTTSPGVPVIAFPSGVSLNGILIIG